MMAGKLKYIVLLFAAVLFCTTAARATDADSIILNSDSTVDEINRGGEVDAVEAKTDAAAKAINPKELIFDHLLDGYGWEVPFNHHKRIPLPVIAFASDGLHCFSSSHLDHGHTYTDGGCTFKIGQAGSKYAGKLVEIVNGEEIRPWDFSITKNVCALFICVLVVGGLMIWLARYIRKNPYKAPRKGLGAVETVLIFVYDGVIKPILGPIAPKFAPYLMTVFFFILVMNLLGLVVVFPGGANLTGNIAITLTLSVCTFIATTFFANKHYWKEIFWPDVPWWMKVPIPVMPIIEIFGMFTKPAALTVRLFANMMGGHIIVITLTMLIFIFSAMSPVAEYPSAFVSLAFSIFMLLIDVLVSFIQAYVFTMLSAIFISQAHEHECEHHEKDGEHAGGESIKKEIEETLV